MKHKIFLDVDGVLADFEGAVEERFGKISNPHQWSFQYMKDFGMGKNEFWKALTPDFWASLKKTPECDLILALVKPYKPVLLTSPPMDETGGSAEGKIRWIRKHLPEYFFGGQYLIGPCKEAVSRPGAILIDDSDANCTAWTNEGGTSVLVPRTWNKASGFPVVEFIQDQLMYFLGEEY